MKSTASSIGKLLWAFILISSVSSVIIGIRNSFSMIPGYMFIFVIAYREKVFATQMLKKPEKKEFLLLGSLAFASLLTSITTSVSSHALGLHQDTSAYRELLGSGWQMFFATVIFAPLAEEILFRGILLNRLRPYGKSFAIVATALLFGIQHSFLIQAGNAIFSGIILASVALQFGLGWSISLHAFNNFLAIFAYNAALNEMVGLMKKIEIVYVSLGILSILYLVRLFYLNRHLFRDWWQENKPERGLFRQLFVNGWLTPLVLLNALSIISMLFVPVKLPVTG